MLHSVSELDVFFGTTETMENGCEIWNIRSVYGVGSLKTAVSELVNYKRYLVAVQEVR